MENRLQKIIADRGYCSRRKAEELIQEGKVKVNGETITAMGTKFEDDVTIEIDGKILKPQTKSGYTYLLFNKPLGVLTTMKDDRGRRTIAELIPEKYGRLFPVGRLDIDTSGLIILTDDGNFANLIMHPSGELPKSYLAKITGRITSTELKQLEKGIMLEDGLTAPAKAEIVSVTMEESEVILTIHEGKNREVRRMFEALNHRVKSLERIKIGHLDTKIGCGHFVEIKEQDILKLKNYCLANRKKAGYKD